MKQNMNRWLARLVMLSVAVILGAIAVAQAQRGLLKPDAEPQAAVTGSEAPVQPILAEQSATPEFAQRPPGAFPLDGAAAALEDRGGLTGISATSAPPSSTAAATSGSAAWQDYPDPTYDLPPDELPPLQPELRVADRSTSPPHGPPTAGRLAAPARNVTVQGLSSEVDSEPEMGLQPPTMVMENLTPDDDLPELQGMEPMPMDQFSPDRTASTDVTEDTENEIGLAEDAVPAPDSAPAATQPSVENAWSPDDELMAQDGAALVLESRSEATPSGPAPAGLRGDASLPESTLAARRSPLRTPGSVASPAQQPSADGLYRTGDDLSAGIPTASGSGQADGSEDDDANSGSSLEASPVPAYTGGATWQLSGEPKPAPQVALRDASRSAAALPAVSETLRQADPGAGIAGQGKPGPLELEGPQTPTLTVTKSAPRELSVGLPATMTTTIRNVGPVDAHDVVVRDAVPHGTQLIATVPSADTAADGALLWQMGTIKSGAEVSVSMELTPQVEGELGSVATVSFKTAASVRSVATQPRLVLEHTGPGQILVGQNVIFHIKLSNSGTGEARNVTLEEDVAEGLQHLDGRELEFRVGTIRPGETRLLELTLKAHKPGVVDNVLIARAEPNVVVEDRCQVEIVAPQMQLAIAGPAKRYLDRRAQFELQIANPGTAPARNVELVARLPAGLKFASTNNAGQYNQRDHAVYWSLAELPAQEMGTVTLDVLPTEMGPQRVRVEARADMNLSDRVEHEVNVEGMAAMLFTVADIVDPIEVGGQTTYEVRIVNQGSKAGTNLRLAAFVPEGMQLISGEGPTRALVEGQRIVFDSLARLAPEADTLYKIHVKGTNPGDKRIQVQLMSDDVSQPVTKEESTHVYSDE